MSSDTNIQAAEPLPIACDLTAIPAGERERHEASSLHLLRTTRLEARELPDGFAFRFASDEATYRAVTEFIRLERLCCPHERLTLTLEPAASPTDRILWLHITAGEGYNDLLRPYLSGENSL